MFEGIHFESERLVTRRLEESDAEALFQIYSDGEVQKYRGSDPLNSLEDAHGMIADGSITNDEFSRLRQGIWSKPDNQLIGTLLLNWDAHLKQQCEIGFSFGSDHWRKGFGKETLKMTEDALKGDGQIELLKAWCIKENTASIKIFQKGGFSEVQQTEYRKSSLFIKRIK